MKVVLLADIHSNLPALQAVLADLPHVDRIVCVGDVVGYYADPNEVCQALRDRKIRTIRGNHDAYVIGALTPNPDRVAAYRTMWTREVLQPDHLAWLKDLPARLEMRCGNLSLKIHHATPWDPEGYLYPDSPQLKDIRLEQGEFLILAHTHWPMLKQCGDGFVLNPGSVGQPRDCNPAASYAILDCDSGAVEFRRVHYDVASLQDRLSKLGWEPATIAILSRTQREKVSPSSPAK
jgi:putative phosphoesterase